MRSCGRTVVLLRLDNWKNPDKIEMKLDQPAWPRSTAPQLPGDAVAGQEARRRHMTGLTSSLVMPLLDTTSNSDEQSFYELYRRSSIGLALTDTLDDLISDERINPQLAMKILGNFDQAITESLQKNVKSRLQFKGSLDTYRFCDEVWTFLIKNVTFKMDNGSQSVHADKVKIVSCNAKKPGEGM
ncbi:hypothetical protein E4U56_007653 [Claviceps arundinis]|uniref:Transcription initiation factor IIA subunit 2 n=1 Tax=Claviceps arundinis TaxID=1623583 RepID=A0A9P7MUJ9_9HYPO|nr:hypothetical protein E4U56_007653 [Claviceps arundinis]